MDIAAILEQVASGELSTAQAQEQLKELSFEELDFAKIDHHRQLRVGFPEVIFCQGKANEHIAKIYEVMNAKSTGVILGTRATPENYEYVKRAVPSAEYLPLARIIRQVNRPMELTGCTVAVVSGGTADIPVAEEAAITAEAYGNRIERVYDVGVAGIHRLFAKLEVIRSADVIIAVAGMEGALASVVGGLVDVPVIACPTSVGYGASFGGLAALLSMLNSCASGTAVVNIDNGFGAGYLASNIIRTAQRIGRRDD